LLAFTSPMWTLTGCKLSWTSNATSDIFLFSRRLRGSCVGGCSLALIVIHNSSCLRVYLVMLGCRCSTCCSIGYPNRCRWNFGPRMGSFDRSILCDSVCFWDTLDDSSSTYGSSLPEYTWEKRHASNLEFYYRGTSP
jgi:hypothetical protein